MSLSSVEGRAYGPTTLHLSETLARQFVETTGDDASRWVTAAPPSFAAALLFAIAPQFLSDPDVAPFTKVLVHSDQRFAWSGPLTHGSVWTVSARVVSVRSRGAMNFVTLEASAAGDNGSSVQSTSVFLMGDAAGTADVAEQTEPAIDVSADNEMAPGSMTGTEIGPVAKSASRLDLVRYAGVSGDFNPVHIYHDAAVQSGLAGIVVHGLLMSSWLLQIAAAATTGDSPLADARLRFKNPLFPGDQAAVSGTRTNPDGGSWVTLSLTSGETTLVTCQANLRASE